MEKMKHGTLQKAWEDYRAAFEYPVSAKLDEHIRTAFMSGVYWAASKSRQEADKQSTLMNNIAGKAYRSLQK